MCRALRATHDHRRISLYDFFWLAHPSRLNALADDPDYFAAQHDLSLLGLNIASSDLEVRDRFLESAAWLWLAAEARSPSQFGALTEKLHNHVRAHPNPFRRDVKTALQNILSWGQALAPERCIVAQPNRSQIVQVT